MTPATRLVLVFALVAGVGLAACGSDGGGAAADSGSVRVTDATIDRPLNPQVAALRFTVHNDTARDDTLIAVSSPVAESVSVHLSETDELDRSVMTPVDELAIPARSSVTFEPGGLHVMLDGLTSKLEVGDEVDATLTFAIAGDIEITAEVVEPGSQPAGAPDDTEDAHAH